MREMATIETAKPRLTKALYFNGVNAYVSIPLSENLIFTKAITVSAWIAICDSGGSSLWPGVVDDRRFRMWLGRNVDPYHPPFYVYINDSNNVSHDVVSYDNWKRERFFNIAITYNGSIAKGYINGDLIKQLTISGLRVPDEPVFVGQNDGRYAICYVSQLLIYRDYALTHEEIKHNLLNPNNPVRKDKLVLWLDARNVIGNRWYDLSTYKNHGTMYYTTVVDLPNQPTV